MVMIKILPLPNMNLREGKSGFISDSLTIYRTDYIVTALFQLKSSYSDYSDFEKEGKRRPISFHSFKYSKLEMESIRSPSNMQTTYVSVKMLYIQTNKKTQSIHQ